MAVLFLQSPYSFFFNAIGSKLKKQGISTYSINFNLGDKFLKKDIPSVWFNSLKINKKKCSCTFEEISSINHLYKALHKNTNIKEEYFYQYALGLESFLIEKKIKCILMQNDTRWQHAIAIYIAQKLEIPFLVFELGLFRPNTITMDCKGVNFNNSLSRDVSFFKRQNSNLLFFNITTVNSSITERKRNLIIASYFIFHKIGELIGINSLDNKEISLYDYLKRFYFSYINKKAEIIKNTPKNYIFVPLQVNLDSQILIHSPYTNMSEFMADVIESVKKYRNISKDNIELIFKEHPMDKGQVNYKRFYSQYKEFPWIHFWSNGNTNNLIKNAKLIITINSTVGIEALEYSKKVICMGNAFYAINGIAIKSNKNKLCDDIITASNNKIDINLINNFLTYLKYNYSVEGNEYYYNNKHIDCICDRILKVL